ncbi:division/cell wall cluster transcriptional repressor MraZ [Tissierella creatinophila]|uniref:Transcriptional regulator MraZ n=1 Tax=Tissierella creatinophila DSM 6911 TaxID=1123403 RepID=A0A1U7M9B3_TISCR|nr:division/cell wall cluster transcriptional repressor MraZ [Tissierella creatinophila]OLS03875.1 protein MraZ [Tissierella creatinophila DSM 6911]
MFIGEHNHTLDNKGRITMPSKFREELGDEFVITKGLDGCLFVYTKDEWKIFEDKLKTLPLTNKDARAFVRFFFAGACECSLDKQNRVLIPPNLRTHSGLEKDAVIIGVSTRIEIWSKNKWNEYSEDENLSYENIAENMAELGI